MRSIAHTCGQYFIGGRWQCSPSPFNRNLLEPHFHLTCSQCACHSLDRQIMSRKHSGNERPTALHSASQFGSGKCSIIDGVLNRGLCHCKRALFKHLNVDCFHFGPNICHPLIHAHPLSPIISVYKLTAFSISLFSLSVFPSFCLIQPLSRTTSTIAAVSTLRLQ